MLFLDFIRRGLCGPACVFILRAARGVSEALYLIRLPVCTDPRRHRCLGRPVSVGADGLPASPSSSSRPRAAVQQGNWTAVPLRYPRAPPPEDEDEDEAQVGRSGSWKLWKLCPENRPKRETAGRVDSCPGNGRPKAPHGAVCPFMLSADSLSFLSSCKGSVMHMTMLCPSLTFFPLFSFFPSLSVSAIPATQAPYLDSSWFDSPYLSPFLSYCLSPLSLCSEFPDRF